MTKQENNYFFFSVQIFRSFTVFTIFGSLRTIYSDYMLGLINNV